MQSLIVLFGVLAAASAVIFDPIYGNRYQYHVQDGLGQYSFGYAGGPSSKSELRTFDGVTRGSYSYVDANGILQTANYVADPILGFRVAATNLPLQPLPIPQPLPVPPQEPAELIAARKAHLDAHARAASGIISRKRRALFDTPEVAAAKMEHALAYNRVLSGLPAIPEGGFVRTVPLETPEVFAAKAAHIQAYADASARTSGFYNGVPIDTPEVLIARGQHYQALLNAQMGVTGSMPVMDTPEVAALKGAHLAAQANWRLAYGL